MREVKKKEKLKLREKEKKWVEEKRGGERREQNGESQRKM